MVSIFPYNQQSLTTTKLKLLHIAFRKPSGLPPHQGTRSWKGLTNPPLSPSLPLSQSTKTLSLKIISSVSDLISQSESSNHLTLLSLVKSKKVSRDRSHSSSSNSINAVSLSKNLASHSISQPSAIPLISSAQASSIALFVSLILSPSKKPLFSSLRSITIIQKVKNLKKNPISQKSKIIKFIKRGQDSKSQPQSSSHQSLALLLSRLSSSSRSIQSLLSLTISKDPSSLDPIHRSIPIISHLLIDLPNQLATSLQSKQDRLGSTQIDFATPTKPVIHSRLGNPNSIIEKHSRSKNHKIILKKSHSSLPSHLRPKLHFNSISSFIQIPQFSFRTSFP